MKHFAEKDMLDSCLDSFNQVLAVNHEQTSGCKRSKNGGRMGYDGGIWEYCGDIFG